MSAAPLPDFLIIGAQRAGTTSLYEYLMRHPDVAAPEEKELHFFDLKWERGVTWYRERFAAARSSRPRQGRPVTGEATPYYVFHPHAPRRIRETLGEVRLIALLRNPVDRALSHHRHEVAMGSETLGFEDAVEAEPERLADEAERMLEDERYYSFAHQHHTYLARGRYAEQLRTWLGLFPWERILVLRSEDMFVDPGPVYDRTLEFLKLPPWRPGRFERYNASDAAGMNPETRSRLAEYFRSHNGELEALLGREMGWER